MFVGFWPRFLPPALGRFWMLGRLEHFALGSWLCKHFAQDAFTRDFTIPCRRSRDKTCYLQRSFVFQQSNLTTYSMLRMLLCKIVVRLKVPASPTVAQRCLSPNPGDSVGKSSAVICGAALYALGFPAQNRHATRNSDLKFWKTRGQRRHEASQLSAHGHQCLDRIWHHRAGSQPDIHLLCYRTCRQGMSRSTSSFKEHTALRRKHKCSLTQPATHGTLPRLSSMNTFLWNFEVLQCSEMLFSCSFPADGTQPRYGQTSSLHPPLASKYLKVQALLTLPLPGLACHITALTASALHPNSVWTLPLPHWYTSWYIVLRIETATQMSGSSS